MLSLVALVFVLGWSATTGDARASDGRGAGAAAASRLVPVWALHDGDLPVSYGRVSVVPTTDDPAHVGDRRPLRQRTGARSERTNAGGVAMLDFARLPKRFTVVVRGGGAKGRRFRGTLYAEVTRHGTDTDVIEVNPVTTLTAYARTAGRGMGAARARRKVKRLLGIPSGHDITSDLRRSDEQFDGDAYLAAVRRHGSVASLHRALLAELRDGDRDKRPFSESGARAASALDWLSLTPEKMVRKGYDELINFAIGTPAAVLQKGALGWLTRIAVDLGLIEAPRDQLAEIQGALEALGKQLTRLEAQADGLYAAIAQDALSRLYHQTDTTLGEIDHAEGQLALLANMSPSDPTMRNFAQTINDYIGSHLLDAPAILRRNLSPGLSLTDNVFKATSKAVAASTIVFGSPQQAKVKSVYDYFAAYQTQLAVLLANYWHSKPDTYSGETIRRSLAQIQDNVTVEQRASLKPPLPDERTWIDPRTGLMWIFTDYPVDGLYLLNALHLNLNILPYAGHPFSNYRLATLDELSRLTSTMGGPARVYLNAQLGFDDAVVRNTWAYDSLYNFEHSDKPPWRPYIRYLGVRMFSLNTNQTFQATEPGYQYGTNTPPDWWPLNQFEPVGRQWLRAKVARGLLLVRRPAANEDYWWGPARPSQ
jgi:hypothetical protein